MKRIYVTNENGFTLIEMMIVMLVISILLIVTIPNVGKHNSNINKKGCDAYVKMVQSQVEAYKMDKNKVPTLEELKSEGYLNDTKGCPNGKQIEIDAEGNVSVISSTGTGAGSS
ncbi:MULTISPECIES: competence type IV pilus major pilin ComGC [Neobacillus]|uniref:ComG operon protein 3 n=1 Tax=Neobacillus sedimentimangrovi TaxID=2699460 RepID=A0ABS8QGT8_9BACI|nr:competence type IV pilus major pilin ComGC [Neobacillus sedimentimangrovi]AIM15594.1 competence protein ComG [Bacillus sp. X1(2014)]MCD4838190.1 prepilin-type N-terminal cleavage/methylation domain-containing protein [Neobacillus sedimentimangrovi]